MPVRIAKPAVNIREKLAELERPIGVNGSALMRTETPQEAISILGIGRRNLLINGDMSIWQRGTSFQNIPGQGSTNYTADRWNATRYLSATQNVTRQEVNYLGFQYALRSERSVGDTMGTSRYINQPIESSLSRNFAGKYVTFSFYARRGSGASTTTAAKGCHISAYVFYHTNNSWLDNGIFYSTFKIPATTSAVSKDFVLTTDFQRFEMTGFIPSDVRQIGVSIGTPEGVATAVANDFFEITGLQLEEGRRATPFEFLHPAEEIAMCQRYYYRTQVYIQAYTAASQDYSVIYHHPVQMRASGVTASSLGDSYTVNISNTIIGSIPSTVSTSSSDKGLRIYVRATNLGYIEKGFDMEVSSEL